jgi:hypothetical protein
MPTQFQYLVKKERAADAVAVEDRYRRKDLANRPVVRDELNNRFLVFDSRRELVDWYGALPEAERCCHETIFDWQAQRLKFDIDAPAHKLDALSEQVLQAASRGGSPPVEDLLPPEDDLLSPEDDLLEELLGSDAAPVRSGAAAKIHAIVNLVIEAILDELYVGYFGVDAEDILATRKDLAVTDSSGPAGGSYKYSYHIIVLPYAVADNEEAREFTARVLERLPSPVRVFVDPDVNKRTQNFRLAGSAKPGTGRVKRLTSEFQTAGDLEFKDLLVVAGPGARVLPRVYASEEPRAKAAPRVSLGRDGPVVSAALDLAAGRGVTDGHVFREVRGTLLCFERERPSHCRICGEVHHRDNSLMLSVEPVEGGHAGAWPGAGRVTCRVVEFCRQARGQSRVVGEIELEAEELRAAAARPAAPAAKKKGPPLGLAELITARVAAIREGRVNPHAAMASEFEKLPDAQKTVYAEPQMREYELTPTLAVSAQMKLGKTKALRRFVEANFPADGIETKVVRFVTFRQTFSRSIADDFPDFTLYSDVAGDLDVVRHPRLIVQVESLHRLRMPTRGEPVDLLILDEVESILGQFNSGLHKHFNAAFAMFRWLLLTARHVICMDANLGDRTFRTLARMRPAHPPHFHWNRHARAADDTYAFTADQSVWLERLHAAVRGDQKVVLASNSLAEARAFDEALRRQFPDKRVMLYSSETAPSEKARHFADVHKYWGDLDVLIYTPTCSAGVSFELEHFDVLFAYFCDVSCDVETCRQMLGRVRRLRTGEHNVCLRATGAALPATVEEIARQIRDKRAGLYRRVEDTALHFEYGAGGEINFYESEYFHLWLETTRVENLSRNDFARRFIDQVADTGARVAVMPAGDATGAGAALLSAHRSEKDALSGARCAAVAAADDLTADEAAQVREAAQAQQDVEPARRLAYEKYQLCEAYSWHGRPVNAEFVAAYESRDARRVYASLCRITECETVAASLEAMRAREASHFDYTMETRSQAFGFVNESRDLLRERHIYVYRSHFLANWLLRVCGFGDLVDKRHVHAAALEARLRAALRDLERAAEQIVFEFEIPPPHFARVGRETDAARFLSGALRPINAVLRRMYGIYVARVPSRAGGDAYYLEQSSLGKRFVFSHDPEPDDTPGGPRPHIPSNLATQEAACENAREVNRLNLFIDGAFYSAKPRAVDEPDADLLDDSDLLDETKMLDDFLADFVAAELRRI